jgi:flagellin FlaB
MHKRIRAFRREQEGITALETAIILIAFVVVASVFAFTILSAGTFTTERGKEAIYEGLSEVRGTLEMRGSMIASGVTTTDVVSDVVFTPANVAGGEPVDMNTNPRVVIVEYRDANQRMEISNWTTTWLGYDDGDGVLEERELVEITVPLTGNLSTTLGKNTQFVIEVKPPSGAVLNMERTTPSVIDTIMDLN